jgi:hypothetical protein
MLKSQACGETYYYGVMRNLDGLAGKNTPGAGGPTPGGTAGGNYSYFFLVLALALGLAAAFFFGAAFFFVAANSLTPFQIIR